MSAGTRAQHSNQVLVQLYGEFKPEEDPETSDAQDALLEALDADYQDVPYRKTVR